MISVAVDFRATRAKRQWRLGVVFFHICGPAKEDSEHDLSHNDCPRKRMTVNTDITGADESAIELHRQEILDLIHILYHIVEDFDKKGRRATAAEVVESFRTIINDKSLKNKLFSSIDLQSPLRADLISIGSRFHNDVQLIFPQPENDSSKDLLSFIEYRAQVCKSENKISTSRSYTALSRELKRFSGNDVIGWNKVTPPFVTKFAESLKDQNLKDSTQRYYLGMLRTLLFQATEYGYCSVSPDWFKGIITKAIPKSHEHTKEKINIEVVKRINQLDLHDNVNLALVRDLFMFAFYCRGMELIDVAHLTRQNIQGNMLVYNRRLTGKEIRIPLEKKAASILNRYSNAGEYIFPLMGYGRANLFPTKRTWVNNQLKVIGKMVGFEGLSFISNVEAWTTMFSNMHITETFLAATK